MSKEQIKETVNELIGEASPEQKEAWKKMYGEFFEIIVRKHCCYLRPFDRNTIKYALSQMTMKVNTETQDVDLDMSKIIDVGEIALDNCWLGGSEEIKSNDTLWVAAAMQAGTLMDLVEAELKKY